jgi:hypothetical protein
MRRLRLLLRLLLGSIAAFVYVWFAAVRNAGRIKRRKHNRRRAFTPSE